MRLIIPFFTLGLGQATPIGMNMTDDGIPMAEDFGFNYVDCERHFVDGMVEGSR